MVIKTLGTITRSGRFLMKKGKKKLSEIPKSIASRWNTYEYYYELELVILVAGTTPFPPQESPPLPRTNLVLTWPPPERCPAKGYFQQLGGKRFLGVEALACRRGGNNLPDPTVPLGLDLCSGSCAVRTGRSPVVHGQVPLVDLVDGGVEEDHHQPHRRGHQHPGLSHIHPRSSWAGQGQDPQCPPWEEPADGRGRRREVPRSGPTLPSPTPAPVAPARCKSWHPFSPAPLAEGSAWGPPWPRAPGEPRPLSRASPVSDASPPPARAAACRPRQLLPTAGPAHFPGTAAARGRTRRNPRPPLGRRRAGGTKLA